MRCIAIHATARTRRSRLYAVLLLLCSSVLASTARADLDCSSLLRETARDWGQADGDYSGIVERYTPRNPDVFTGLGTEVQMYLPGYWRESPHPEAPADAPELIVEAIRNTMQLLRPYHAPPRICAVLSPAVAGQSGDDWDFDTLADTRAPGVCRVKVYMTGILPQGDAGGRRSGRLAARELQATVAHEVYHCYQETYFHDQATGRLFEDSTWWVESTAEYIANRLYPCNDNSIGFAGDYDPAHDLFSQPVSYGNVVLFQYLAEQQGFDLAALKAFSQSMPTIPGTDRQRAALAARPGIGQQFHAFARALIDRSVYSCFDPVVNTGHVPETTAQDMQSVILRVDPFAITQQRVVFGKGRQFRVRVETHGGGGHGRDGADELSYRDERTPGHWTLRGDGEFTVTAGCDDDLTYRFAATSARADDAPTEIELTFTEQEKSAVSATGCCIDTGQHDHCVVGTWEVDREFMDQQMRAILGAAASLLPGTGRERITYLANGRATGLVNSTTQGRLHHRGIPEDSQFTVHVDSSGRGSWSTEHSNVLHTCSRGETPAVEKDIVHPWGERDTGAVVLPPVVAVSFPYQCHGDVLELELPGGVMKKRYRRIHE